MFVFTYLGISTIPILSHPHMILPDFGYLKLFDSLTKYRLILRKFINHIDNPLLILQQKLIRVLIRKQVHNLRLWEVINPILPIISWILNLIKHCRGIFSCNCFHDSESLSDILVLIPQLEYICVQLLHHLIILDLLLSQCHVPLQHFLHHISTMHDSLECSFLWDICMCLVTGLVCLGCWSICGHLPLHRCYIGLCLGKWLFLGETFLWTVALADLS